MKPRLHPTTPLHPTPIISYKSYTICKGYRSRVEWGGRVVQQRVLLDPPYNKTSTSRTPMKNRRTSTELGITDHRLRVACAPETPRTCVLGGNMNPRPGKPTVQRHPIQTMKPDYLFVKLSDDFGLNFIGKRRDLNSETVELCAPNGRPVFQVPRRCVTNITMEKVAELLLHEARYRRGLPSRPPSIP